MPELDGQPNEHDVRAALEPALTEQHGRDLSSSVWEATVAGVARQFFAATDVSAEKLDRVARQIVSLRRLDNEFAEVYAGGELHRMLGLVSVAANADRALLALRSPNADGQEAGNLVLVAMSSSSGAKTPRTIPSLDPSSAISRALRLGIPTSASRSDANVADRQDLHLLGIEHLVAVPVGARGNGTDGLVLLLKGGAVPFEPGDLRAFGKWWTSLSDLAGWLVDRGLHLETGQLRFHQDVMGRMGALLEISPGQEDDSSGDDFESVSDRILFGWEGLVGAELATLWYFDHQSGVFAARATHGHDIRALDPQWLAASDCLLGRALRPDAKGKLPSDPELYWEDFKDHAAFRYPHVAAFMPFADMLILPIEMRGGRLLGCVTLYLPIARRFLRAERGTSVARLRALSLTFFALLEQALYAEGLRVIDAVLAKLREPTSPRTEIGALDDVAAVVAEQFSARVCHIFYAEDGMNAYLSGTSMGWKQVEQGAGIAREELRFRMDDPALSWSPNASSRIFGKFVRNSLNGSLPDPVQSFLEASGAEGKPLTMMLLRGEFLGQSRSVGLIILVGPRHCRGYEATRTELWCVEDVRKLNVVSSVLLWAVRTRLDVLGKDRFVALMKHGVGGALQSVLSDCSLLANYLDKGRVKQANEVCEVLRSHLARLRMGYAAGDLYLKMMRGEKKLPRSHPERLGEIVRSVVQLCRPEAEERKQVSIEVVWNVSQKVEIRASQEAAQLALYSVLDNAVKYSFFEHPHGVQIRIERVGEFAQIVVSDFGVRIPEADLERIFDLYVRSKVPDQAYNRTGTGIGLYLTKQIVEAYGGTVWATSTPDKGNHANKVELTIRWPIVPGSAGEST